ncbi:MAG: hypothetical protein KME13_03050 [Myxacorys californica WJT36-NPBG1]|nr:hypothetical protein [Myxacorys californica WJT36-NPBG1]
MTITRDEHHRRKRTVYHFAPLAHFVARFRSTAPFGRCALRTQQAAGNQPEEIESGFSWILCLSSGLLSLVAFCQSISR